MGSGVGELLAKIDVGVLGGAMLDAAAAAGIGVTVTFVDSARPVNAYISERAAQILGWPAEELMDRDPMAFIAPEDRAWAENRYARRHSGAERGQTSYELRIQRKDGTYASIELTAGTANVDGRATVFAFLVDASVRREAEEEKYRYEARFRQLIEIAPEPIGIIRDGRFVWVNRAYAKVLAYDAPEQLVGVEISTLVEPEDVPTQRSREAALILKGVQQPPHVYRVRKRDGSRLLLEVTSVFIEYEGRPAAFTMARDVTLRRQLERQLVEADRLAALGTLAAGIAHEINNPLAYVMLNLEWIARKLPDVKRDPSSAAGLMAMLDEARQGAERVSTIVRELRSFSRADGDSRHPVDMARVVQSAIRMVGNEIRHRAHVVTAFDSVRAVWGNEARLEQVVVNLLLNAAQAMPEARSEENEIRVEVRPDADGHAVLEVHDNGAGIAPEVLPRIFDPFFTTKPVGLGTGLGLSICHGIVTSLGGQIGAHSDPGRGTTFRVVLPTSETVAGDAPSTASPPPSSQTGKRARVLVIDDELPIANTLRELLAPEHHVVAAVSAREGLAKIDSEEFDVVFCDLMMPGMSGMDLYHRVRTERPGLAERIVFMTGGAFTARAAEFLASVDNLRVEKPFSLGLIETIVRDMAAGGGPRAARHRSG
ncbi:MAG TPA: PAS domain S-box protein [Polyangiaceae bacterium]